MFLRGKLCQIWYRTRIVKVMIRRIIRPCILKIVEGIIIRLQASKYRN